MRSQLEKDLMAARALIATPETWCPKGQGERRIPTRCAMQAVLDATDLIRERYEACARALYDAMPPQARELGEADLSEQAKYATDGGRIVLLTRATVVAWYNDELDTSHADIMALFDRAIEAERAKRAQLAIALRLLDEHAAEIMRDLRLDTQVQQIINKALETGPPLPLAQCPKVDEPA